MITVLYLHASGLLGVLEDPCNSVVGACQALIVAGLGWARRGAHSGTQGTLTTFDAHHQPMSFQFSEFFLYFVFNF